MRTDEARSPWAARLENAIDRAERGIPSALPFLTPAEQKGAERVLRSQGRAEQAYFFGGYAGAERARLFLLPTYLTDCLPDAPTSCEAWQVEAVLGETLTDAVCAVRIEGSGYRELTHRDYLGSLLGLGLERDAIGDIALQSKHAAVTFCSRTVADFLCKELCKVASDTVRTRLWEIDESFTDGREYQPIHTTLASARLDCVVAALTNLSREAAQSAVRAGEVEVEFEAAERVDMLLQPPLTLSVRGHGRFRLCAFEGETRKGRLRLFAQKYV